MAHVGTFIKEECRARGWSRDELAIRMGGNEPQASGFNRLTLDFCLDIQDTTLRLDNETAERLGKAFGVSPDVFTNLDRMWRLDMNKEKGLTA